MTTTNSESEHKKRILVPLIVLLLCAVSLTGAAYAYSSQLVVDDKGEIGTDGAVMLNLYDSSGNPLTHTTPTGKLDVEFLSKTKITTGTTVNLTEWYANLTGTSTIYGLKATTQSELLEMSKVRISLFEDTTFHLTSEILYQDYRVVGSGNIDVEFWNVYQYNERFNGSHVYTYHAITLVNDAFEYDGETYQVYSYGTPETYVMSKDAATFYEMTDSTTPVVSGEALVPTALPDSILKYAVKNGSYYYDMIDDKLYSITSSRNPILVNVYDGTDTGKKVAAVYVISQDKENYYSLDSFDNYSTFVADTVAKDMMPIAVNISLSTHVGADKATKTGEYKTAVEGTDGNTVYDYNLRMNVLYTVKIYVDYVTINGVDVKKTGSSTSMANYVKVGESTHGTGPHETTEGPFSYDLDLDQMTGEEIIQLFFGTSPSSATQTATGWKGTFDFETLFETVTNGVEQNVPQ